MISRSRKDSEWPRLALYEDHSPIIGFHQASAGEPIDLVQTGKPPHFIAKVIPGQLRRFCSVFGLDYPKGQFEEANK